MTIQKKDHDAGDDVDDYKTKIVKMAMNLKQFCSNGNKGKQRL